MDKTLTGKVFIEKMSDDFNILSQFEMTINSIPPFSYVECNELEVLTKEMNAYDYPSESHPSNIMKLEKKARLTSTR